MVTEVKQYFTSYRSPGWDAPVNTTPQESTPIEQPEVQIQPNGWVINSSANVFIDEEGLHIYDGALFLIDISGRSVLGPSGFSGSWSLFQASGGIYNSDFGSGTIGALVVNEVGTGDTTADYEASQSAQLPYWIITLDTYNALALVADADAASGQAIEIDASLMADTDPTLTELLYQDVPVVPGRSYLAEIQFKRVATPSVRVKIEASWRDADHGLITSPTGQGYGWYINSSAVSDTEYESFLFQVRTIAGGSLDVAPPNAAYVRFKIGFAGWGVSTGQLRMSSVQLREESPAVGRIRFHNRTNSDDSITPIALYSDGGDIGFKDDTHDTATLRLGDGPFGGYVGWGPGTSGSAADIYLRRQGTEHLELTPSVRLDADVSGRGIRRAGGQSTGTGAWVKQTGFSSTPISAIGSSYNSTRSSLVITHPGVYIIQVSARFNALAATGRYGLGIAIANNADPGAATPLPEFTDLRGNSDAANHYVSTSFITHLDANDNICLYAWQDSGVAKTVDAVNLNAFRLGT